MEILISDAEAIAVKVAIISIMATIVAITVLTFLLLFIFSALPLIFYTLEKCTCMIFIIAHFFKKVKLKFKKIKNRDISLFFGNFKFLELFNLKGIKFNRGFATKHGNHDF